MKKVLYTTLAGAALLSVAVPTAVSAYENISQGVAGVDQVASKEYAIAVGELQSRLTTYKAAGQAQIAAQYQLEAAEKALQTKIDSAQTELNTLKTQREEALGLATSGVSGVAAFMVKGTAVQFTGPETKARVDLVDATFKPLIEAAEKALAEAKDPNNSEHAVVNVARESLELANKAYNEAKAAYEEQFAKTQALYDAFRQVNPEEAAKVDSPEKVVASGNASSGNGASSKSTSSSAASGQKVLPNTSAVR